MRYTPAQNRAIIAGILADAASEGMLLTYATLSANVEARDGPLFAMQALAGALPYIDAVAKDLGAPRLGVLVVRSDGSTSYKALESLNIEEEDLERMRAEAFAYPWAKIRAKLTDPEAFEAHEKRLVQLRVPKELAPSLREFGEVVRALPRDKAMAVLERCLRIAGT